MASLRRGENGENERQGGCTSAAASSVGECADALSANTFPFPLSSHSQPVAVVCFVWERRRSERNKQAASSTGRGRHWTISSVSSFCSVHFASRRLPAAHSLPAIESPVGLSSCEFEFEAWTGRSLADAPSRASAAAATAGLPLGGRRVGSTNESVRRTSPRYSFISSTCA